MDVSERQSMRAYPLSFSFMSIVMKCQLTHLHFCCCRLERVCLRLRFWIGPQLGRWVVQFLSSTHKHSPYNTAVVNKKCQQPAASGVLTFFFAFCTTKWARKSYLLCLTAQSPLARIVTVTIFSLKTFASQMQACTVEHPKPWCLTPWLSCPGGTRCATHT